MRRAATSRPILALLVSGLVVWPMGRQARGADAEPTPAVVAPDSGRTPAAAHDVDVHPGDGSQVGGQAVAADSSAVDSLFAWTAWPAIGPAIALDALDGPEDILEKEEIIEDRIDDLSAEGGRLDSLAILYGDRRRALDAQLEVLEDLADLQLDGNLEFQQRLDEVRADLRRAQDLEARADRARRALADRVQSLRALSHDYRVRAADLRAREERR